MTRRRLGRDAVRSLAGSASLDEAVATLLRSPYRHAVREDQTLGELQRAIVETLLWNARVLAGWAPGAGVAILRALAGPVEASCVEERLWHFADAEQLPPYRLGALSTAWPRLAQTNSAGGMRRVLATSPWGDPGGQTPREIVLAMRAAAADRVVTTAPAVAPWAIAAVALLVAREVIRNGDELPPRARSIARRVIGAAAMSATTLPELAVALPPSARWALAGIASSDDLWIAESRWWRRVEQDAFSLAHGAISGPDVLLGTVGLLAADAWRVRAALELAARGGAPLEVFDAVA